MNGGSLRVAQPVGEVGREGLHGRAVDELTGSDDFKDSRVDLLLDAGILTAYVHHVQLHVPLGVGDGGEDRAGMLCVRSQNSQLDRINLR